MLDKCFMLPRKAEIEDFMCKYKLDNYLVEPKLDGYRCKIIKDKSDVRVLLRSGKVVNDKTQHIVDSLKKLKEDFIIEGELVTESFSKLTSIMKSNKPDSSIQFCAFDILKLNNDILIDNNLVDRRFSLEQLNIPIVPALHFNNVFDFETAFKKIVEKFEGVVMKRKDSRYWNGTYSDWLKIKRFYTLDMKIMDKQEYEKEWGWKILVVGEGRRVWIRSNKDYPIGSIVEVKYQELTKKSLRFASILRERIDKNV